MYQQQWRVFNNEIKKIMDAHPISIESWINFFFHYDAEPRRSDETRNLSWRGVGIVVVGFVFVYCLCFRMSDVFLLLYRLL